MAIKHKSAKSENQAVYARRINLNGKHDNLIN
jgi:hypothetical protein